MQSQQDLRHQLSDRQTRLRSLIRFVHENGALARVRVYTWSQRSILKYSLWSVATSKPPEVIPRRGTIDDGRESLDLSQPTRRVKHLSLVLVQGTVVLTICYNAAIRHHLSPGVY